MEFAAIIISSYMIRLLLVFVYLFVSCQSKKQLSQNLAGNCFWDILDKRYTNVPNTTYKFNNNGKAYYFHYMFREGKKTDTIRLYTDDNDDNIRPNIWNAEDDSILNIRGYKMKIIRYTQDSIFLNFSNHDDLIILIRNCNPVMKKKYYLVFMPLLVYISSKTSLLPTYVERSFMSLGQNTYNIPQFIILCL